MKACIKLLLLLIISINVAGQQSYVDSLKRVLKTAQTDSALFDIQSNLVYFYILQNSDSALYYQDKCIILAQKNNKKLEEARILDVKGYTLMGLGKLPESYQCFPRALKIAEDPENESKTWYRDSTATPRKLRLSILSSVHNDFGHLMGTIGKRDQQIFQYNEVKRISEEIKDTAMLGFVNGNIGDVYIQLGKLDSALSMQETTAQIFIKTGDKRYLSGVYISTAEIYLKKTNNTLALQYLHKALQSATEQANAAGLNQCYSSFANFYLTTQKNKDSSLYYSHKLFAGLQSAGSHNFGYAYSKLSASYELNNMIDSAYKYKKLASIYYDSSYNARIDGLTKVQKLSFDGQLKLQDLEKNKAATKNKFITYALLCGLGVLFIIGLILFRNNRQKQKINKVLEKTLSDLQSAQSQLIQSEKMASLGELTAGIAHEIQNPLNFVNNFSEVNKELLVEIKEELQKGNYDDAKKIIEDVIGNEEKINHHGKRADSIVKSMLQHAQTNRGQKAPTDINALADEYLRLSYHGMRAKDKTFNATLLTGFDESIDTISIVPGDVSRVLLNLFNNAFYAVNEKAIQHDAGYVPTITLTTKKLNNVIEITVTDNGSGIPKNIADKIFQPFFTTKPTGKGTGLGLSLSYDIIKAHGGEIKVESTDGKETKFIITLPF